MIMTRRHRTDRFTPDELVHLRRSLVTAGEHADCPRCHEPLSVVFSVNDRTLGACRVICDACGGTLDVTDQAKAFLL